MKSSRVLMSVVVVVVAFSGCLNLVKYINGHAVYQDENDSSIKHVPVGTIISLTCGDYLDDAVRSDTGFFMMGTVGSDHGYCTFHNISFPGEYLETKYYECDPDATDNCDYYLVADPTLIEVKLGTVQYKFLCHEVAACEAWCDAHADITCPSAECTQCITDCEADQC